MMWGNALNTSEETVLNNFKREVTSLFFFSKVLQDFHKTYWYSLEMCSVKGNIKFDLKIHLKYHLF